MNKRMGEVFKELRLSRGITLEEATGDFFSISQLSKFENGFSDITSAKLLHSLDAITVNLEEFVFMINEYKPPFFEELGMKLKSIHNKQDIQTLTTLYHQEKELAIYGKYQKFHALNSIVIATMINKLDSSFPVSEIAIKKLSDYLFSVSYWGYYELFLVLSSCMQIKIDLLISFANEMLKRTEYYQDISKNRNIILKILINTLNRCSENSKFNEARKFIKIITKKIEDESELHIKSMFLYAKGFHQVKIGNQEKGKQMMKDVIEIFHKLDCPYLEKLYKDDYVAMFKEEL
ncbi:MAG: hypothetical protein LBL38_00115 [Lactobacillales bacterium]|nr:hypothetical protein [Lactobacillales bacterium]